MRGLHASLTAALLALATPLASGSPLEVMDSRGDMLGWEAVGRVDLGGRGFCTGVLIAPDEVLTAAHCVFDDTRGGVQRPTEQLRFRAGYLNGTALSQRTVSKVVVSNGYNPREPGVSRANILRDVALLRLESPIFSSEANPFHVHSDPQAGDSLQVMSYGKGREEAMSWQRACNLMSRQAGLLVFDCDVTFGSSGAPVFVRYGNRVRILSLVSAVGTDNTGAHRAFGMELPDQVARLRERLRQSDAPSLQGSNGAKRIRVGGGLPQVGTRAGGAKFLRPGE